VNLNQASLLSADLEGASFQDVSLDGTDLQDANLEYTSWQEVDFSRCNLTGAIFTDAQGLSQENKQWLQNHGALNVPD
ncbi:MAG: pentapeptide repeat-containing protein, partial [Kamptonema sp. SIO4C4]|nr:pentapeptide repeat-containing protein [Kamptonema sp. SIO4C4]